MDSLSGPYPCAGGCDAGSADDSICGNGRIAFSDPSGSVGSQITVNMEITDSENLASADVMLAYDSNMLEFVSGTNAEGEPERSGFTETEEHRIPPSCGLP